MTRPGAASGGWPGWATTGTLKKLVDLRAKLQRGKRSVNQLQDPLHNSRLGGLAAAAAGDTEPGGAAQRGGDAVSKGSVLRLEPSAQRAGGDRAVLLPTAGLGLPGLRAPFLKSQACAVGRGC